MDKLTNPVAMRIQELLKTLTPQQVEQINNIRDLPKEEICLKKIKRKMKPNLSEGDIFAMHLPEDVYMFGKIIRMTHNIPMIDEDFFIVFVGDKVSKEMSNYQTEFDDEHITMGPWIIGEGLWRNGTFFTVGHCDITEKEKQLDYGFFKFKRYPNGYIVDVDGKVLDKEPKYLEHGAYHTINGIEFDVREALILHPEIMENVK